MGQREFPETVTIRLPAGTLRRFRDALGNTDRAEFLRRVILAALDEQEIETARAGRLANVETLIA
jgi:hypothetical protein